MASEAAVTVSKTDEGWQGKLGCYLCFRSCAGGEKGCFPTCDQTPWRRPLLTRVLEEKGGGGREGEGGEWVGLG